MLRIPSSLPQELEDLIERVIGCCIRVHRALGPGLLESIYAGALCIEFKHEGIGYEREREIPVFYRDELVCCQRLDIVVANEVVLEIKSVERLCAVHDAQILSYMRLAKLRAGLLVNFNVPVLKDGLKRKVL
jgi:GxxExxY protein